MTAPVRFIVEHGPDYWALPARQQLSVPQNVVITTIGGAAREGIACQGNAVSDNDNN
jgi:hypothetical protein